MEHRRFNWMRSTYIPSGMTPNGSKVVGGVIFFDRGTNAPWTWTADGGPVKFLKLPDGYRVFPHWHPKTERLTIIQGVVNLGTGDRFDAEGTRALSAGTYSSMPPRMAHFAWMKGETILQLSSIGPWEVVYVNPGDDPRNR